MLAFSAVVVAWLALPGFAQSEVVQSPQPPASVDGFRSAKFGMSQDEVRRAIKTDFDLEGEAVTFSENPVERTDVLSVTVPDLLDDGGVAEISYVFGYKSAALIQAGISWSAASDPALDPVRLYANGEVLRRHFLAQGFVPETIQTSTVLDSGVLLFRGEDAQGRATILLLQGNFSDNADGEQALIPESLTLLYADNADQPDVFEVQLDQF